MLYVSFLIFYTKFRFGSSVLYPSSSLVWPHRRCCTTGSSKGITQYIIRFRSHVLVRLVHSPEAAQVLALDFGRGIDLHFAADYRCIHFDSTFARKRERLKMGASMNRRNTTLWHWLPFSNRNLIRNQHLARRHRTVLVLLPWNCLRVDRAGKSKARRTPFCTRPNGTWSRTSRWRTLLSKSSTWRPSDALDPSCSKTSRSG